MFYKLEYVMKDFVNETHNLTNDFHIRIALKLELCTYYSGDSETLILDELALRHGATRIDVVVINDILHGFELKSDKDTLERLPDQIRIYNSVLDRITLVVSYRHAYEAFQLVPDWWGVKLAQMEKDGVIISEARDPGDNPMLDAVEIAKLLWRDEALAFLNELGAADGVRSKPRAAIYKRLTEVTDLDLLRSRVRQQLKRRINWRSGAQQALNGD